MSNAPDRHAREHAHIEDHPLVASAESMVTGDREAFLRFWEVPVFFGEVKAHS